MNKRSRFLHAKAFRVSGFRVLGFRVLGFRVLCLDSAGPLPPSTIQLFPLLGIPAQATQRVNPGVTVVWKGQGTSATKTRRDAVVDPAAPLLHCALPRIVSDRTKLIGTKVVN